MSLRTNRGFTLVELLVVVAIIILLAAILTPGFGRAMVLARRSKCAGNIRDIVRACSVYADAKRENRGGMARALPSTGPEDTVANRQCLWLLVKYDYTSPDALVCAAMRKQKPAPNNADELAREHCGYSFISMVDRGDTGAPPVLTLDNAPRGMVIVGDLNPRSEGTGTFNTDLNGKNSASHGVLASGNEGQNIGRLDGSASWTTSPIVITGSNNADLIYQSTSATGDTTGRAGGPEDVFLIP